MCFSPQADLVGGVVVGAFGVDAVRHVGGRREYAALAALPLLLGAHQLDETLVWWGLQGHVGSGVGHAATWAYLLVAFVVLPIYVPAAIYALEPPGTRRRIVGALIGLGAVVSALLLAAIARGPVTATLGDYHVSYGTGIHKGMFIVAAYVVATCGSLLVSGYRHIVMFGVINLIAVAVLAVFVLDGFASLWCGWAAITSGAIALQLRFGAPHRSMVETPV